MSTIPQPRSAATGTRGMNKPRLTREGVEAVYEKAQATYRQAQITFSNARLDLDSDWKAAQDKHAKDNHAFDKAILRYKKDLASLAEEDKA